jgi:Ca-activated chloride channel family protein
MKTSKIFKGRTATALTCFLILACAPTEAKLEEPVHMTDRYSANEEEAEYDMADSAEGSMATEMPAMSAPTHSEPPLPADPAWNTERYRSIQESGFKSAEITPLSTFGIDVDTAGYSIIRSYLTRGQMPPTGAVRIEEMLNYFDYNYPAPTGSEAFSINTTTASAPWNKERRLLRIGIKGKEMSTERTPPLNLVFLLDVSGSMNDSNKLPLLKKSLAMLVKKLRSVDKVGIVVYAGASGVVLRPTSERNEILTALERLEAGGSTNGGEGIEAAYKLADEHFSKESINRVILATDGDFNVGRTSESDLVTLIEKKAERGVFLTVLGFGSGNYNDSTMEQLADKGNGNYAYIDTIEEAQKVLVQQMSGTLVTIAKDVKIQVEFNPSVVESYRLIGYENRQLAAEDFNDDKKDAGEIGAGHTVTALYEVIMKGSNDSAKPSIDKLRYKASKNQSAETFEIATVKVRYKEPAGSKSTLITNIVPNKTEALDSTDKDFKFAAAVAGFGMKLRGSKLAGDLDYQTLMELSRHGLDNDQFGLRAEFIGLIRKAAAVDAHH